MKLPKTIIKKYGISKKAWSVFRNRRAAGDTRLKETTMAKRKRRSTRRAVSFRSAKKRTRRSSAAGFGRGKLLAVVAGAALYGAGREWMSNKLQPLTSKIPAGDLADEVGMGLLSYAVATNKVPFVNRIPMAKEIGMAGLTIESARVGAYLGAKYLPGATQNTVTNTQATTFGGWQ